MLREVRLFDEASGYPSEGLLRLKRDVGSIPPMSIKRARLSRKRRGEVLASAIVSLHAMHRARDRDIGYRQKALLHGIRMLAELERGVAPGPRS